jgi:hypothetical protein
MNDDAPKSLFIWGYADMQSGRHQVRVRESIQEEGNMFDLARDPQMTLPSDPIMVELLINIPGETIILEMNPTIYPKEQGAFSVEQNIIHEVEYPIPKGTKCAVRVKNLETGKVAISSFVGVTAPEFSFPFDNPWFETQYSFTNDQSPFHISFAARSSMVEKYVMEIKYADLLQSGDTVCQMAIFEGQPFYGTGSGVYNRPFPLDYLFNIFNRTIPDDPQVKFRWFHRFNFKCQAASEDLRTYLKLAERFNDNRKLLFTNIDGGFGLFWICDHTETGDIKPTLTFPDTLSTSPATNDLKFTRYFFPGTYIEPDHE